MKVVVALCLCFSVGSFILACMAFFHSSSSPTFRRVTCQGFEVVDAEGRVFCTIENGSLGTGHGLTLWDGEGRARIAIGLDHNGAAKVEVLDEAGKRRYAVVVPAIVEEP